MSDHYIVTAHKASSVTAAVVGNFMGRPGERNLLLAKGPRIEIYALAPSGLVPLLELPMYGLIVSLLLLPPATGAAAASERFAGLGDAGEKGQQKRRLQPAADASPPATEDLLVLTAKLQFCVLRWNPATREVMTIAGGDARDNLGRVMDRPFMSVADPDGRCVGMHLYENLFRIIPRGWTTEAFNVRLGETVRDIAFLYGAASIPVLAVLYSDGDDAVHLKMLGVKLDYKDFTDAPGGHTNLEQTASTLIAVPPPFFGCLVIGEQTISYFPPSSGEDVSAARQAATAAPTAASDVDEISAVPAASSRAGGSGSVAALVSIPIAATIIKAVGRMDASGARYLLGDHKGQLSMLILESSPMAPGIVTRLSMEPLGETSIPSTLSYLDNGFVFVGSHFGDSQLVRLRSQAADNAYVEVVEHFQNLGPIVDFCVVDLERQGQGQVVTCSGAFKDGSLRVLRNGIGITEQASENLPGIKAMFSLRSSTATAFHSLLLMSFTAETRVLELVDGEEMAEASPPGLEASASTLHAGNLSGDLVVQACPSVVVLLDASAKFVRSHEWTPPAGTRVVAASSAGRQVLVAVAGGLLVSLLVDVSAKKFVVAASVTLPNEVSCVDCSLLSANAPPASSRDDDDAMADVDVTPASTARESPTMAAVGMWTEVSVRLLSLPDLRPLRTEPLDGQVIARSVLLATLENVDYLLVALGDGHLFTFRVDASVVPTTDPSSETGGALPEVQPVLCATAQASLLSDRKRVTVGSQPASLSAFTTRDATHVFAACDRPTVVHASAGGTKLLFSHVNLRAVTRVVGFHSAAFPDCLAVATPTSLLLGAVDDIQKLHIRTVPLGEGPRRIAHAPVAHMFAVLTTALAVDESGDETEDHYLRLLDDTTFETRDSFKLDINEMGFSLLSTTLPSLSDTTNRGLDMNVGDGDVPGGGTAGEECFVLGTAYTLPDEDEPSKGRLLAFTVEGGQLRLRAELSVQGAVYCINHLRGMLVAGVNHRVLLLAWSVRGGVSGSNRALVVRDTCDGSTVALLLATRGDFVIVGDMIKSVTVLRFSTSGDGTERLEEVARDYGCHWMTAVAAVDDEVSLGGENGFNLITLRRRSGAVNEDERAQLDLVGTFHTGEFINRLLPGSLVMREDSPVDGSSSPKSSSAAASTSPQTLLYGSVSGAVGVLVRLSSADFQLLRRVEAALNDVIKGIGGLQHAEWRAFATEAAGPSSGFGTTTLGNGVTNQARGYIDGDLIERFLDLDRNKAAVVAEAVDLSVEDLANRVEELARLH
ncbi:hypothetical protein MMPV_009813 [Pyropia vietnamensis]